MSTKDIVQKLWNLCNILRDDGITYHQYVTELTYILFLKMINETGTEDRLILAVRDNYQKGLAQYAKEHDVEINQLNDKECDDLKSLLYDYSWKKLTKLEGLKLKQYYNSLLAALGSAPLEEIRQIYEKAVSSIDEPRNLKKLITEIDKIEWYDAKAEGLGDLYEGLLQKNAEEKKSGAGQYFTPRVLIEVMTELIDPKQGEKCFDPACGTFGFMISAYKAATNGKSYENLDVVERIKLENSFGGVELVSDTHRLALMNAYLHNVPANIECMDFLSSDSKKFKGFDVIMTNPPFGTKKGGERPTRDDISFRTSNKQLNFLQAIYRSLKADGNARCAVILPDNVLFADGDGTSVRRELMNLCNVQAILRLPTGIFYAQGVKTNVLIFTRGKTERDNTTQIVYYDLRTELDRSHKRHSLTKSDFNEFLTGFKDSNKRIGERWSCYTREEIERKYDDNLDLGLIRIETNKEHDDFIDPIICGEEAITQLEEAADLLRGIIRDLRIFQNSEKS